MDNEACRSICICKLHHIKVTFSNRSSIFVIILADFCSCARFSPKRHRYASEYKVGTIIIVLEL